MSNQSSTPVQVRLFLSTNPGFHSAAEIAAATGLDKKNVSSALSRLAKQDRVVKEGTTYADPTNQEAPAEVPTPAEPEPTEDLVEETEDLIGEETETPAQKRANSKERRKNADVLATPEAGKEPEDETLFYEFLDFPGNYSIVTAPMAVEIAEAAGVAAKIETFSGKLTRRVHFGGSDMTAAADVVSFIQERLPEVLTNLHDWQKKNIERRRGLTDMQRYVEHREFIAKAGHRIAKQVKKDGI